VTDKKERKALQGSRCLLNTGFTVYVHGEKAQILVWQSSLTSSWFLWSARCRSICFRHTRRGNYSPDGAMWCVKLWTNLKIYSKENYLY